MEAQPPPEQGGTGDGGRMRSSAFRRPQQDASHRQCLRQADSIGTCGVAVFDGGLATHLEDKLQKNISASPLWSAALLADEEGCAAIKQTHKDFLNAGSDVISSATYQASVLSLTEHGYSQEEARKLLILSVQLAIDARDEWWSEQLPRATSRRRPLIALSMGPYGAALSNGAEYSGHYIVSGTQDTRATAAVMEAFHYDRLAAIASSRAVWSEIDVLAFETVPRIDEARTIRRALSRLYKNQPLLGGQLQQSESASPPLERKAALASFVFPELKDGQLLSVPFDEEQTLHSDRNHTTPSHMVMGAIVEAALGDVVGGALPFDAIGINCTRPHIVRQLVAPLTKAVADAQVPFQPQPFLFVYPDGGLVWDGARRQWRAEEGGSGSDAEAGCSSPWARDIFATVKAAINDSPNGSANSRPWAGCFVGGCCKTTSGHIAGLRALVDEAHSTI